MPGLVVDRRVLPHRQVQEDDARGGEVAADGHDLFGGLAVARALVVVRAVEAERALVAAVGGEVHEAVEEDGVAGVPRSAARARPRTPAAPRRRRAAAPRGRARPARLRSRMRAQRSPMEAPGPLTGVTGTRGRPRGAAATRAWAASAAGRRARGRRAASAAATPSSSSTAGAASTGAVIQQEPYPMACAALQSSWTARAEALEVGALPQPVALFARQPAPLVELVRERVVGPPEDGDHHGGLGEERRVGAVGLELLLHAGGLRPGAHLVQDLVDRLPHRRRAGRRPRPR